MLTAGLDEVGRGAWAGPIVVGAVILNRPITGLRDSKLLTKKQRERLNAFICAEAQAFGLGWVSSFEIDELGLTDAIKLAYRRAVALLDGKPEKIIIDGNYNFLPEFNIVETIIGADRQIPAVSAASIIAKVARDKYMENAAILYAGYGWSSNAGYGTAEHRTALVALGPSLLHRRSYRPIKEIDVIRKI